MYFITLDAPALAAFATSLGFKMTAADNNSQVCRHGVVRFSANAENNDTKRDVGQRAAIEIKHMQEKANFCETGADASGEKCGHIGFARHLCPTRLACCSCSGQPS